jgi:murein DD-endopeptidase MepM/ murein hydrolase activator NlpD
MTPDQGLNVLNRQRPTPIAPITQGLALLLAVGLAACQSHPPKPTQRERPWVNQPLAQSLPIPVEGVSVRSLTDTWGAARSNGRRHEGIDIFAAKGTPIRSTTVGVVQKISEGGAGGKAISILGPASSRHYYAHLQRFAALKVGDQVNVGTILGTVGDTGNAKGGRPHLHYGIYLNDGRAVNPYPYLVR